MIPLEPAMPTAVLAIALLMADPLATAQADRLYREGRYRDAADAYYALLRQSPRDPKLLDSMAHSVWKMGRAPDAVRFFREELAVAPNNRSAERSLGAVLQEANAFDEARAVLAGLTQLEPEIQMNWYYLGLVDYQNGYFSAAVQALDRALAPGLPQGKLGGAERNRAEIARAISLLQAGRGDEAARDIPRLLRMPATANDLDLLLSYVQLLWERSDYTGALNADSKALEISPSNANAHFWRARILMRLGRTADAVGEAERSRDLAPGSPSPRNLLVKLYRMQGRANDSDREAEWLRRAEAQANGRQANGPGR